MATVRGASWRLDRPVQSERPTASGGPWTPAEGHHYTVAELAEQWNMSTDFVRRLFVREPGVLEFSNVRPGRRRYRVLRIPSAIAERIYRRSQVA
jgi:hypothetical protein